MISLLVEDTVGQLRDGVGELGIKFEIGGNVATAHIANDTPLFIRLTEVAEVPYQIPRIAIAAFEGPVERLMDEIQNFSETINLPYDGLTALNISIKDVELVAALLAAGADPSREDAFGRTPLHTLVFAPIDETAKVEIATLLLKAGAQPDKIDSAGRNPANLAREQELHVLSSLLEPKAVATPAVDKIQKVPPTYCEGRSGGAVAGGARFF